jgi:hypothetical protein
MYSNVSFEGPSPWMMGVKASMHLAADVDDSLSEETLYPGLHYVSIMCQLDLTVGRLKTPWLSRWTGMTA